SSPATPAHSGGVQLNREMRRLQAKEDERAKKKRTERAQPKKKERVGIRQYFREVRQELKKVAWPSREELTTYTIVVFAVTTVITLIVFGLDWGFSKGILYLLENLA
ncbi:MAG: preprotein translocase subunit SecE, partial [Actinomycetota bacterium]